MEIELWNGETKAIIDPQGAWLTNLSDQSGDIFFPKRSLTTPDGMVKVRGGSHVCLPNFGPDAAGIQPQHGFARTSDWSVLRQNDSSVTLSLSAGEGEYASLAADMTYELLLAGIRMTLEVHNTGAVDLRCAPAFHPYFSLARTEDEVLMDSQQCKLDDLAEVRFVEGDAHALTTQSRAFTLRSKGLPVWAQWTDALAPYVCFEPTVAGFSFLQEESLEDENLLPGQRRRYELLVEWHAVAH